MTNLVAVLAHTNRGGEVLLESGAHILNSELGGITAVGGAFYRGIPGVRGAMDLARLEQAIRTPTRQGFGTALDCMETTHNRAGGAVLPLEHMREVAALARDRGVPVHTDGARIFNAAAALRCDAAALAAHTDSIGFCVSKGLSAPVGSVLCGSRAFIERARAFRRMVGGNMRQAGPLASAGVIALETMVDRLAEDHATAAKLARDLHRIDANFVDPNNVETNIVKVNVPVNGPPAAEWSSELERSNVRVSPCDSYALRFVTHRHIGDREVDDAIAAFTQVWRRIAREIERDERESRSAVSPRG
jgi:threonine aldolase